MGRKLGGIEESELRELIQGVIQESMSQTQEDVKRLMRGFESLELQMQQDREDVAQRVDDEVQKATAQQKGDIQETLDQLDMLDVKVDKRLEAFNQRIETFLDQKVNFEDMEDKIYGLSQRIEQVGSNGEFGVRLEDVERVLRQKAGTNHVDSELGALRKGMQNKVDASDVEEKLAAAKQRIWQKAESAIGAIQVQLQKKADMLSINDRMDRLEQQVALIPGNPCETPNELSKRLEGIDRCLQQKADNEAIDASIDELEQLMQRKADCTLVDERLKKLERRLQGMGEITDWTDRIADMEESIAQKADLSDFARLQLAVDRTLQSAEAASRSHSASARLRGGAGPLEADGMPPLRPQGRPGSNSRKATQQVIRRGVASNGRASEAQPSPRQPASAWRPNLTLREDSRGPSPTALRRSRSPGAIEASPWATPRGNSRAASADAVQRLHPTRLFGAATDQGPISPRKLQSPPRSSSRRSSSEVRSHSPGPRMWRPRRQQ